MFERFSYTWSLMRASWDVLRRDKGLVIFPLLSLASCVLVVLSFAIPIIYVRPSLRPPVGHDQQAGQIAYYGLLFLFYFSNYFVITFFNTAIVSCAVEVLAGGQPTVGWGLQQAMSRIHLIIGWALVAATVGLLLRIIAERSPKVGAIVASLLGALWSIGTYLVVPVLVVQNKGPIAAVKESTRLLKKTWGEQIIGNFSFGAVFGLLSIPAFVLFGLAVFVWSSTRNFPLAAAIVGIGVLWMIGLSLVHSALQSIFQAAVYLYTQDSLPAADASGRGFPVQLVRGAMTQKA